MAARAEVWAQIGARYGLAFGFPLLDRRVVEYALSLPSELFLRGGFRRRAFRDAMTDVLPAPVRLRHQKYRPFPGRVVDIGDGRDELLAQIDAYERNESVRRVINLARLRQLVEAFPPPEHVREEIRRGHNVSAAVSMIAAASALTTAAYLHQHASE
jgi:asparagine synthase (glutamine-hydrolysing)